MSESSNDRLQIGSIFVGKVAAMIATFVMPMFLTRFLSKSDYGIYSQYYLVVAFLASFFSLGLQSNLYYFYPKASLLKRNTLVFQTLLLLLLVAFFSGFILHIPFVAHYLLGAELINYKYLIILAVILTIPIGIIEPLYVLKNDRRTSIYYPPISIIIKVVAVTVLAITMNKLIYIFGGFIISSFFIFLFVIFYLFKEFYITQKEFKLPRIEFKLLKEQISYSLPFGLAVSINALASRFDKIVCLTYLSTSDYASYSVAFLGIPAIQQIYESYSQVYLVKMSSKWQKNNPVEILNILKNLISKTYSYTIPVILIFLLYAKKIIVFLFTVKYEDSTPLFQVYLLSFLFIMMGTGLVLRATGETRYTFKAYLFGCIISLPSTFLLIKFYGIWGAMTGAIIAIIAPKLFMVIYEIRVLNSSIMSYFPFRNILKIISISIIPIVPFYFLERLYPCNLFFSIILSLIYLTIVFILEIKFKVFLLEFQDIESIIQKYFNKYPLFKRFSLIILQKIKQKDSV